MSAALPRWPDGLVGSMTHCDGYCAAALSAPPTSSPSASTPNRTGRSPEGVGPSVFLPAELTRLDQLAARYPAVHWDRLLLSAKESVYKAWFPLTRKWLDFSEADITLRPDPEGEQSGALRAVLLVPGPSVGGRPLQVFEGRWVVREGVVATSVVIPHAPAAP